MGIRTTKKAVTSMDVFKKENIILRKRGQITIPKEMVDQLDLHEGDTLEIRIEDGKMVLVPTIAIAKDQAWFWTKEWQQEEMESAEQMAEGRVTEAMDVDEAIRYLERIED